MSLPTTPSGGARLRRGVLALGAVALSAALSACAAGRDAQTLGVRPDNAAVTVDTIKIQNASVVTQPTRETEGPAVVTATVFNTDTKAQTIDSITLPGGGAVKLSAVGGKGAVTVPAQGSIMIGGKGNASAVIDNGTTVAKNIGGVQEVVFRFSETGDVKLQAFVVPATSYFTGYGPSALPKPPATTGRPSASPSGSPAASPSGSPSESASGHAGEPGNGESDEPDEPSDSASASHSAGSEH